MTPRPTHRRDEGFTIVAVLVVAGLIASFAATYARHVVTNKYGALASHSTIGAQEACQSTAEYTRQALLTGQAVAPSVLEANGALTAVTVTDLGADRRSILTQTMLPDGTEATKLLETKLERDPSQAPAGPDALPRLGQQDVDDLMADTSIPKTYYTADTVVADTELTGILVVGDGVELRLSDVVLDGVIVSGSVLTSDPFGSFDQTTAPTVIVDGSLRIDSGDFLPGVAILMPDGVVATGFYDGRLQIGGDVIAHSISLDLPGMANGHVLSVTQPVLDPALDPIWSERRPQAWSDDLDVGGTWDARFLATMPKTSTIGELSGITGYWSN